MNDLRQALRRPAFFGSLLLEVRPGRTLALGLSVGGAVFPQDGDTYEALLAAADGRMYRDKADRKRDAGRDSVNDAAPFAVD